jgi:Domain of unknown function (DUF4287)/Domain of unknown function (DUF5655)
VSDANMSEWQRKWFATGLANFEKRTGRSMVEWVAIARTCPETKHRARLQWFKDNYGLLQNSASWVISNAFPSEEGGWNEPEKLRAALWTDPASTAILEAVERMVKALPDTSSGQRKGYSAWSHKVQFVAIRPIKGGAARLGLAVEPSANARLVPARNEGWSERLKAALPLASAAEVDAEVEALLMAAWERS